MRAKSTSGLPGHTHTPPADTPPDTNTGTTIAATSTVDVQRLAWLLVADGLVQGCPCPRTLSTRPGSSYVFLDTDQADDVASWAAFLGLDAPYVTTREDDARRLLVTVTSASGERHGFEWRVDHYTHDPLPDEPGNRAGDVTGEVGGVE